MTLLASQAARATTLLQGYTDLASWEAAVAEIGVDTFNGIAASGGHTTYNTATGYNTDALGIDFVGAFGAGYSLQIVDALYNSPYYNFGSGASLGSGTVSTSLQPYITVALPGNVTAIALNVMTYGSAYPVTLTASDGTTFQVATASGQQSFHGFTFSAPVSTLTISIPGAPNFTSVLLDNFRIGTADVAAPEPATMLLIGLGLVFMAFLRKRRHA